MKQINKLNQEIQKFLENEYQESNKTKLYEFADLTPEDTNLSVVIWVDGPRNMPHTKRIKFQNNNSPKLNGGELIPMTISDNPQIPLKIKLKIKEKELADIKRWVLLNKEILLDYANDKITTKQLYQLLKPIDYLNT